MRMELLQTKAELERELLKWLLDCRRCNRRVHWVEGVGPEPGHWAHAEPAPPEHGPVFPVPRRFPIRNGTETGREAQPRARLAFENVNVLRSATMIQKLRARSGTGSRRGPRTW
jgi:hypothetical protein